MSAGLTRRGFLASTFAAGLWTIGPSTRSRAAPGPEPAGTAFGAWLRLAPDGSVTVLTNVSEMGQGTHGAIAQIVAEELSVSPRHVRVAMAPVEEAFANRFIRNYATFGSLGLRTAYASLAPVAAGARDMLLRAAAARWRADVADLQLDDGRVRHADGRSLAVGELLADAAVLTPPEPPTPRKREHWKVLGRPMQRPDLRSKTDGSARFGIDVRLPGMRFAAVRHAPTFGGRLEGVDPSPAMSVPGVRQVVRLDDAVAVVADGWWAAQQGAQALAPQWRAGPHAGTDSQTLSAALREAAQRGDGRPFPARLDRRLDAQATDRALGGAATVIDALYEVPFLAHAAMEPLNATVRIDAQGAELWLSTQSQADTRRGVARALGLQPAQVTVHSQLVGGGFGRRLEHDFAVQAALIARAVGPGIPVQTIWSREVDMRSGRYRPAAAARVRLGLGADGLPLALRADLAHPSVLEHTGLTNGPPGGDLDWTATMGWLRQSYEIGALHLGWTRVDHGVPCAYWRSVGASQNTFFLECTLDRAARALGRDPVDYRRTLLRGHPRALAFVDALAQRAGWHRPLPPGRFRGFAMSEANHAISGHVVELSLAGPGRFRLERITAAIDAGWAANPDAVQAQMMGGTVFGLSAALAGEITLRAGQVEQGNFDTYPLVTMAQLPPLDVLVLQNGDRPAGVGEEGPPTIAPAVANALLAATGTPVQRLPLRRAGWELATG